MSTVEMVFGEDYQIQGSVFSYVQNIVGAITKSSGQNAQSRCSAYLSPTGLALSACDRHVNDRRYSCYHHLRSYYSKN